jgi:hypothetical protein
MERYDFLASGEWKSSMNNKRRGKEPLDVASISSWHSKHRSGVWYGYVLSDCQPSRAQIGFTICRNRSYGFSPHVR